MFRNGYLRISLIGFFLCKESKTRNSSPQQVMYLDVQSFQTESCCDFLKVYNSTGKLITFNVKSSAIIKFFLNFVT